VRSSQLAREAVGLVEGDGIHLLREPATLIEIIGSPEAMTESARRARRAPAAVLPLCEAELAAPIPTPPSVRDFNAFEEHVVNANRALGLEVDPLWYEFPAFYFSNPAAIRGPTETIAMPPCTSAFDFELEVAAIIGRAGRDIPVEHAEQHIAGFTVLCDWSARDLQEREMRLNLGPAKGKDSATSIGPFLVTPDELDRYRSGNAYELAMRAFVNGTQYSSGNLASIYWSFSSLVAFASRGTELRTGDILGSGTVGTGSILELARVHGADRYHWLLPGDEVRLEVEHLGAVSTVIAPYRVGLQL